MAQTRTGNSNTTIQELPNGQIILNIPRVFAIIMRYNKGDTISFAIEQNALALHKGSQLPTPLACPACKGSTIFYDGSLGYEAIRCHNCHIEYDRNSDNSSPFDCNCKGKKTPQPKTTKDANTSTIQELPNGQLTLNIPRALAKALKYKKGDHITFEQRDFTLLLHNDKTA